jgi:hypothetical protein
MVTPVELPSIYITISRPLLDVPSGNSEVMLTVEGCPASTVEGERDSCEYKSTFILAETTTSPEVDGG